MGSSNNQREKPTRLDGPGSHGPTPYLRKQVEAMLKAGCDPARNYAVDLACGNGRNSEYLRAMGWEHVQSLDLHDDYEHAERWMVEWEIPCGLAEADFILCQYLLMFIGVSSQYHLCAEINRVANTGCILIVELQDVKSGYMDDTTLQHFIERLIDTTWRSSNNEWRIIHQTKYRATLQLQLQKGD